MEYTIYSESLVYYALRNEDGYLMFKNGQYQIGHELTEVVFYPSISKALEFVNETEKPFENLEVRKVKVIDIGGLNEYEIGG